MESTAMKLVPGKNEQKKVNNAVQFINIRNIYLPGEVVTVSYSVKDESLLDKADSVIVQREELIGVDRLRERWAVSVKSHGDVRRIRLQMPEISAFEPYHADKKNTFRGVRYRFIYVDQDNVILSRSESFKITDQFEVTLPYNHAVNIRENQLAAEVRNQLTCPSQQPYHKPPVITELNMDYKIDRELFIEPVMHYWTTNNGWRKPVYPHHYQKILGVTGGAYLPFRYSSPETGLMRRGRSMSPNTSMRVYNNTLSSLFEAVQSIEEMIHNFEEIQRATQQQFLTLCQRIKTQQVQIKNVEAKVMDQENPPKLNKITLEPETMKDLSNIKLSCNELQLYVDDLTYSSAMQAKQDIIDRNSTIKESAQEPTNLSGCSLWEIEERHYKRFSKSQNQFTKKLRALRKQRLNLLENISHIAQVHDHRMERHMIDEESARELHRRTKMRNEKRIAGLNEMIGALRIGGILRQPLLQIIQDLEDQIERRDDLIKHIESDDYQQEKHIHNTLLRHIENLESLIEEKNLEICRLNLDSLETTGTQDKICSTHSKTDKSLKTDDLKTTDRCTGVAETCSEDLYSLHHHVMKQSQLHKSQSSGCRVPNNRARSEKKIRKTTTEQQTHNEIILYKENVLLRALVDLLTIQTPPPIQPQWFSPVANHKRVQKAAMRQKAKDILSSDSLENSLKMLFEKESETRTTGSNDSLRVALQRMFAEDDHDQHLNQLSSGSLADSLLPLFGPEPRPETHYVKSTKKAKTGNRSNLGEKEKRTRFNTSSESLNECLRNLLVETESSNTSFSETDTDSLTNFNTQASGSASSLDWETLRWVLGSDTSLNKVKQPEPTFRPSAQDFHKVLLMLCEMKSDEKHDKESSKEKPRKQTAFTTSNDSLSESLARLFEETSNETLNTANPVYNVDLAEGAIFTSNPVRAESSNTRSTQARRLAGMRVSDTTDVGQAIQNRTEFRSTTQNVGQPDFRSSTDQSVMEPITSVEQVIIERIDRRDRQYRNNKTKKVTTRKRRL